MKWQTTRKIIPWTTTATREVWPDIKMPLLPGGIVSKTPGERRIKRTRESQDILSRCVLFWSKEIPYIPNMPESKLDYTHLKSLVTRMNENILKMSIAQVVRKNKGIFKDKAVVYKMSDASGLFSVFFFLCQAYIYAKETKADFYLENSPTWQYRHKEGWSDYFNSLKTRQPDQQFPFFYKDTEIFEHLRVENIPQYSLSQYEQAVKEIYRPSESILNQAESIRRGIGSSYSSLYVRRGDKVSGKFKEIDIMPIEEILARANIKDDGSTLFIQTDDFTVVEEAMKLIPSCRVITMTPSTAKGSFIEELHRLSPDEKRIHTENLLVSIEVFLGGSSCWTDHRSNVGRLQKLLAFDRVQFYDEELVVDRNATIRPYYSLVL